MTDAPDLDSASPATVTPLRPERGARVEVRKLGKAYIHNGQPLPVLEGVDLSLSPGDMVAVVGASGVGKSTLLQILGTLDLPTSGSIKFNGEEITTMSATRLAEFRNRRIGFVFQFHHLLPEFSVRENLLMPARIAGARVDRRLLGWQAQLADLLGIGDLLDKPADELSGGQKQRVAIGRSLINRPDLVLADEPTGNLDTQNAQAVNALFRDVHRTLGTTFVIVTHDAGMAETADRVLEVRDGTIARDTAVAV